MAKADDGVKATVLQQRPLVVHVGHVDAVVIVLLDVKTAFVVVDGPVEVGRVAAQLKQPFVDRAGEAQRLRIGGDLGLAVCSQDFFGLQQRCHCHRLVDFALGVFLFAVFIGHQRQPLRQKQVGFAVGLALHLLADGLFEQPNRLTKALGLLGSLGRLDDAGQANASCGTRLQALAWRQVGGWLDITLRGVAGRCHAGQVLEHRAVRLRLDLRCGLQPPLLDGDELGQHRRQVRDKALLLGGADAVAAVIVLVHHKRAQVERDALDQHRLGNDHRGVGLLGMAHTQLVKHVGVQGGQVGNDDVGVVDPAVHDRVNAAAEVGIDRPKTVDVDLVAGRPHQLLIGLVEVEHPPG